MYSIELLKQHLETQWGTDSTELKWPHDPHGKMLHSFRVLEFPPNERHSYWVYSTLGMSFDVEESLIELHLFSTKQDVALVELLTTAASFHRNDANLGLHHSVNFGRLWQDNSACSYGFISLPYLDGETLEMFDFADGHLHNLWLIPITESERDYKMEYGWDALEEKFEACGLDYLNPNREACA
jgi:hypothetical protein